jgi:hypothetical protein
MTMEKVEYCNLIKKLNEQWKLIFDDIMHRKQMCLDSSSCLFFIGDVAIGKTFTNWNS